MNRPLPQSEWCCCLSPPFDESGPRPLLNTHPQTLQLRVGRCSTGQLVYFHAGGQQSPWQQRNPLPKTTLPAGVCCGVVTTGLPASRPSARSNQLGDVGQDTGNSPPPAAQLAGQTKPLVSSNVATMLWPCLKPTGSTPLSRFSQGACWRSWLHFLPSTSFACSNCSVKTSSLQANLVSSRPSRIHIES